MTIKKLLALAHEAGAGGIDFDEFLRVLEVEVGDGRGHGIKAPTQPCIRASHSKKGDNLD